MKICKKNVAAGLCWLVLVLSAVPVQAAPEKMPPLMAVVLPVTDKAGAEALAKRFGVALVGELDEIASDACLFLPLVTPAIFTVYRVESMAGSYEVRDVIAQYALQQGEALVCSPFRFVWNQDTENNDPQRVIAVSHGRDGEKHFMWHLPEDEYPEFHAGFISLQKYSGQKP